MTSTADLERINDLLAGPGAWRMERDFLDVLGFETAQHRGGNRWRRETGEAWSALPGATRSFERALSVAHRINPQLTYAVDATAPGLGIDVELFFGGHSFKGTHDELAVACCRALLAYMIAFRSQQARLAL